MNLKQLSNTPSWEWPEDAAEVVLETLTNRKASKRDRLLAADLAGEYVILSENLADALLGIAGSDQESAELRSSAAIALGPGLEEANIGDYDDPDDSPALSQPFVQKIQRTLHSVYSDPNAPKEVRRAVLEASVRQTQSWHAGAIRSSFDSEDKEWRLTSVFCMRYVKGFESQILEALKSSERDIEFHAVQAAGNWEIDAAWPHIARLVTEPDTEKEMLLAAIEAAVLIRPGEAEILDPLLDSGDEDIAEAANDAMNEAGYATDLDPDDIEDDDEDDWSDDDDEGGDDDDEGENNGKRRDK